MTGSGTKNALGRQLSAARILIFGGVSLILAGMLLGEIFAIFVSHVATAQVRREWLANMIPAIERQDRLALSSGYNRIEDLSARRGRIMDTHSHIIAFGFLALGLALLQPANKYPEHARRWLALCIIAGGVMQSLFIFVSYWLVPGSREWALSASAVGGALILAGVLGNSLGLRGAHSHRDFAHETSRRLASPSSRILVRTGAVLIFVGMWFGFYYAWIFVTDHEPHQLALLKSATHSAMAGDSSAARDAILNYRGLLSRTAIVTAAHSHVIEMGIMAILLGFVQDFVFLSNPWKRRWAIVFSIGAAIMPVCTYCASLYGLLFAGFADAFGLMSVIALFAMLSGLIRNGGVLEGGCPS